MTLDEAIKHAEEVADTCEHDAKSWDKTDAYESHVACGIGKCGEEHRQLAEWLKDYKRLMSAIDDIKAEIMNMSITSTNPEDYTRTMAELCSLKLRVLQIIDKHIGGRNEE